MSFVNPLSGLLGNNKTIVTDNEIKMISSFNKKLEETKDINIALKEFTSDASTELVREAKECGNTGLDLNNYTTATNRAAASTKLLNMAINTFAMIAISAIIQAAVNKWNELNVTVEEAKQKVDNLSSSLEGLNREFEQLSSKDEITAEEQFRLDYLEKRIKLEERLLDLAKAEEAKEELGSAGNITDYFDEDNYLNKIQKEFGHTARSDLKGYALDIFTSVFQGNGVNYNKYIKTPLEQTTSDVNDLIEKYSWLNDEIEELTTSGEKQALLAKDEEERAKLSSKTVDYLSEMTSKYIEYSSEIDNINEKLKYSQYLSSDQISQYNDYLKQYESGRKQLLDNIINLSYSSGNLTFLDSIDMEEYISSKIDEIDDEEISRQLSALLSGKLTIEDANSLLDSILELDGFNENSPLYIYLKAGFSNKGSRFQDVKSILENQYDDRGIDITDGKILSLSSEDLEIASKLQIPPGVLLSWDELNSKIEAYKNNVIESKYIYSNIADYLSTSSSSSIKDDLVSLSQAGKLDKESLKSYENFDEIVKALGKDASISDDELDAMINTINSMASQNPVDYLHNYGTELEKLSDAYIAFSKGERIDASTLSSLQDSFGYLDSYKDFEKQVLSGNKDLQSSFDSLATELAQNVLNSITDVMNVTDGLTEENKEYYEAELQSIGVANAHEVVEQALANTQKERQDVLDDLMSANDSVKDSNAGLIISTEELNEATLEEIAALVTEAEQSGYTAEALAKFGMKKAIAAGIDFTNAKEISYLLDLAKASGIATEAVTELARVQAEIERLGHLHVQNIGYEIDGLKQEAYHLAQEIVNEVNSFTSTDYKIKISYDGGDKVKDQLKKDAESTTKKTEKEFKETFDWAENSLDNINAKISEMQAKIDSGTLSWKEQLDTLKDIEDEYGELVKYYYGNGKKNKGYIAEAESRYNNSISTIGGENASKYEKYIKGTKKFNLETFNGNEELYNAIKEAAEAYQNWQDAITKGLEAKASALEAKINTIDAKIDWKNAYRDVRNIKIDHYNEKVDAGTATESDYKKLDDLYQKQIGNTRDIVNLEKQKLEKLTEGTVEYEEQALVVKQSRLEVEKLIEAYSSLPIKKLEQITEELEKQKQAVDDILKEYDDAVSGVNYIIKEKIKDLEEARDAAIKPLQTELDNLQKQNEAREKNLALQKALYELEKARNQKTIRVMRNGKWEYEADQDAISSAQDSYDQAAYNKKVYDLQTSIKLIEEQYKLQIDALNKWLEDFNEAVDKWNNNQLVQAAEKMLGKSSSEITSAAQNGDTGIYESFIQNYEVLKQSSKDIEEQIALNKDAIENANKVIESNTETNEKLKESIETVLGENGTLSSELSNIIGEILKNSTPNAIDNKDPNGADSQATNDSIVTNTDRTIEATNSGFESENDTLDKHRSAMDKDTDTLSSDIKNDTANTTDKIEEQTEQLIENNTVLTEETNEINAMYTNQIVSAINVGFAQMSNALATAVNSIYQKGFSDGAASVAASMGAGAAVNGGIVTPSFANGGMNKLKSGKSLVGEEGAEIIVHKKDGTADLVTAPSYQNLEPGDIVFDADETKKIIRTKDGATLTPVDNVTPLALSKSFAPDIMGTSMQNFAKQMNIPDIKKIENNSTTTLHVDNISLPNVHTQDDARQIVEALCNLTNETIQTKHRK